MQTARPTIAAFDFDGTLTYRDTLFPFLRSCVGNLNAYKKILHLLPEFLAYGLNFYSRQMIKESVLTAFLSHVSQEQLYFEGERFACQQLPKLLKPNGINKLEWHLKQGHPCFLVTANIPFQIKSWADKMGFQQIVTSRCEITAQGTLTGKLIGLNCWGPEKARRLAELLGPRENYILYAYGDSRGDKELLEMADFPFYRTFD